MFASLCEKIGYDGVATHRDVSIACFTTLGIGGKARCFIAPVTLDGLAKSIEILYSEQMPFKVLGNGSNLLVNDRGVDVVLTTTSLADLIVIDPRKRAWKNDFSCSNLDELLDLNSLDPDGFYILAHSGCRLKRLVSFAVARGLEGLERLCGIPATIGGAVSMNAGANGAQVLDVVEAVCFAGETGMFWKTKEQLKYGYRFFEVPKNSMVAAVLLGLKRGERKRLEATVRQMMGERSKKQPLGKASAGCVFKNPAGMSAGLLLDRCGLKGRQRGGAQVSTLHANFIINTGLANSSDFEGLMQEMQHTVFEHTSVWLEPEIVVWK